MISDADGTPTPPEPVPTPNGDGQPKSRGKPYQKGHDAPGPGRPPSFEGALRRALRKRDPVTGKRFLDLVAVELIDLATKAEMEFARVASINSIRDTIDGKPTQKVVAVVGVVSPDTDSSLGEAVRSLLGVQGSSGLVLPATVVEPPTNPGSNGVDHA